MADPFIQQLFLSPWSGAPARGQLPQVPQRAALPTAVAELAGCLVRIPGGSGAADATYECQKQAAGTYAWVQIDGGSGGPLGSLGTASGVTQTGITTETALTGVTVSATVGTSRLIRVSVSLQLNPSVAGGVTFIRPKQDGTALISWIEICASTASYQAYSLNIITAPTPGAHTYTVTLEQNATPGGSVSVVSASLLVEDVGAA